MEELVNYNFNKDDLLEEDFDLLYKKIRRDSCFAYAYKNNEGKAILLRDHLGNIPLYFRFIDDEIKISLNFSDLIIPGDKITKRGLLSFLSFGTIKLRSLVKDIEIVNPGTVIEVDSETKNVKVLYSFLFKKRKYLLKRKKFLIDQLDFLFNQAIKRTIKRENVGLYLSGGMDSALVGIYLKKNGIKVNAYTSAPWGMSGTEVEFSKINAERIEVQKHTIVPLETREYEKYFNRIIEDYKDPHGTTTSIGVLSLLDKTDIKNEKQVYAAQNTDTMTCSVFAQYSVFFASFFPLFIRKKIYYLFKHGSVLGNYLSILSKDILNDFDEEDYFSKKYKLSDFDLIQYLTLLGMYIGHTPSDGEVLSKPLVNRGIIFSNPYYDVDLIEFNLSVPFWQRLSFSFKSKTFLSFEKKLFRKLAEKYLPDDLVYRKKGFTIPNNRDDLSKDFYGKMENIYNTIPLSGDNEKKFSAKIIDKWLTENKLQF